MLHLILLGKCVHRYSGYERSSCYMSSNSTMRKIRQGEGSKLRCEAGNSKIDSSDEVESPVTLFGDASQADEEKAIR